MTVREDSQLNITETRLQLVEDDGCKVKANASIVIDGGFAVHDLKILEGFKGEYVAMPYRTLTNRCPDCNHKNPMRNNYCGQCGVALKKERVYLDRDGRPQLTMDVCHPINKECRDQLSEIVLNAFWLERDKPGSVPGLYDFKAKGDELRSDIRKSENSVRAKEKV